jgi:PAS domain S-box-containing protein
VVLLIEDDLGLIELSSEILNKVSDNVVSFQTGKEAIKWLINQKPYFMVLDYSLPDMNAFEFLSTLKESDIPLPPFIVSTGQGDERIAVEMMKLGAVDYIVKDSHFWDMFPVIVNNLHSSIQKDKMLAEAQKSLIDLNQFNQQIIQSANEGIIVYDMEGKYQIWNPFMEKLTGILAADVLGKTPLSIFPFLEQQGIIDKINRALKGEKFINQEFPFAIKQTGKQGWASDSTSPLYDVNQQIIGVITTVRDVTLLKQAENTLKKSEKKFRNIFENIRDVYFQTKIDGEIIELSPSIQVLTGYKKEELIGQSIADLYFNPLERKVFVEELLTKTEIVDAERVFRNKHGEALFVSINAHVVRYREEVPVFIEGTIHDISDRKMAEMAILENMEKLSKVFDTMEEGISLNELIFNDNGDIVDYRIVEVNAAFEKITALKKEQVIGRLGTEVFEFPQAYIIEFWKEHKKNKETIKTEMYRPDGDKWIYINTSQPFDNKFVVSFFDITERKKLEIKLQESEFFFKESQKAGKIGSYKTDFVKGMWVSSDVLDGIFGIDKNYNRSVQGWLDLVHPDDRTMMYNYLMEEVIANRKPFDKQYRIVRVSDGETRWVKGMGQTEFDKEGNILSLIGTINDITERKEIEIKLQDSELKYRTMIEYSNDLIWALDLQGNFTFLNQVALNVTGLIYKEWIGKTFVPLILPEDLPEISNIFMRTIHGEVCNYELRIKNSQGKMLTILTNTSPIIIDGKVEGVVSFGRDYTAQFEAEKQLKLLNSAIQQSTVSIVITDKSGNIEYVNPKFSEVTGYSSSEAQGQNPRVLKSGMQDARFYKELWDTILTGNSWQGEFHNKTKAGKSYWESAVISPVFNQKNEIEHFIAIKEDITEKKWILGQLIEAKNKAEENERLKSAFLQNISHEIRTPMNSIVGFSKLLQRTDLSAEKQRNYTSIIVNSTNQLLTIYSDILTISSLETHQERLFVQQMNLNEMLADLYDQFLVQRKTKDITLTLNCPLTDEQAEIFADKMKLSQIVSNLLFNAFKFTHNGEIEFGYLAESLLENKKEPKIIFYTKDTGIGIEEKIQEKIFERFYQADHSINRKYGGNGIGLSISKGFVELMGGEIWVESAPAKGSVFKFTVPFRPVSENALDAINLKRKRLVKTILVAEDELFNYLLIEEILSDMNYSLIHAYDGKEALNICMENQDIDMVLMDIKMPNMDGKTATEKIRKFRPEIPIIALTAYALDRDIEKFSHLFDNYLTKPIDGDGLKQVIFDFFDLSDD